ncbi:unnamed protein product [Prunus armeniaca]
MAGAAEDGWSDGGCWKADVKSSRNEAATSLAKDVSSLRKKTRIPSAEKTQVGVVPLSSARVKHLVGADNKKIGSMRNIRDVPLKPCSVKWFAHELVYLLRGQEMLIFLSEDGDRTRRSAHLPYHHDPAVESQVVKLGVDSASLTSLEVRMVANKRTRESSARAKGSSTTFAADLKVDKSSLARNAGVVVEDELPVNPVYLLQLVDYIYQASDLDTFLSLSLEKEREATFHLLQRGVVVDLVSRKDAYLLLESKNADISLSYDKLLARFGAYHKSAEKSKFDAITDAYKLGYCWSVANLAAWCSGLRGCSSTRNVLLLDAVLLCAGVPARSTMR